MLHVEVPKRRNPVWGYLLSILLFLLLLLLFLYGVRAIAARTDEDRLHALSDTVKRASVECYAIEGRYPPSVEYVEEHYGVVIDHSRYHVFYDGWASNVMPDITILPAEKQEGKGRQ